MNVDFPELQSLDEGEFPKVAKPTAAQAAASSCGTFDEYKDVLSYLNSNDVSGEQMIKSHFQEPDMVKMKAKTDQEA